MAQALSVSEIAAICQLLASRLQKIHVSPHTPCRNGGSCPYHRSRTCWFAHDQQQPQKPESPCSRAQTGDLIPRYAHTLDKAAAVAETTQPVTSVNLQTDLNSVHAEIQTKAAANSAHKTSATQTAPLPSRSHASTATKPPVATNDAATQSHDQQQPQKQESPRSRVETGDLIPKPADILDKAAATAESTQSVTSVNTQTDLKSVNAEIQTQAAAKSAHKTSATQTASLPPRCNASTATKPPAATNDAATQSFEAARIPSDIQSSVDVKDAPSVRLAHNPYFHKLRPPDECASLSSNFDFRSYRIDIPCSNR